MRYIASLCFHYDSANGSKLQFASISYFFSFRPTPSCRLSPACGPQIIPRPQVGGRADRYRFSCGRRRRDPPASNHISFALSRCSFAIARSCPFLLASARSRSLSPICGVPLSVQPPDTESGERISFRQFPAPRLLQSTLERRGGDAVSPTSPRPAVSPFRLPCLLAALSFLYKPGMVIGYSVATVIYFS